MSGEITLATLFTNRILDLTLLPTEQCNFRCKYCYEEFTDGTMHPELIDSIKILIAKRSVELGYLRIGWFGGEPLLAHAVVLDISNFVNKLSKEKKGFKYVSGMSTNGYLLDCDMMSKLIDVGVTAYQVSLDGSADLHDRQRIRRNGGPTFDRIWRNLVELKSSDLEFVINLRVHYSHDNIEEIKNFTDILREQFSADRRFRIFFKTIEKLGGRNDGELNVCSHEEARRIKSGLLHRLGTSMEDAMPESKCYICYAGKPNAFVIRRDGRVVKCTVGLDDPQNLVGYLQPGGRMEIIDQAVRPWLEGAVKLDADFLRCPRAGIGG